MALRDNFHNDKQELSKGKSLRKPINKISPFYDKSKDSRILAFKLMERIYTEKEFKLQKGSYKLFRLVINPEERVSFGSEGYNNKFQGDNRFMSTVNSFSLGLV